MTLRILFLCARQSSRAFMAASILAAIAEAKWDAWSTPTQDQHGLVVAKHVLQEQRIPLLASNRVIEPTWGLHWDEGVVLCSGMADT